MRIKQWISVLLCTLLCVAMLPTMAFAADETDTWDGSADISWYDAEQTEFHITTAEQLAGLATLVNANTDTFKGKTIYLENDLDLSGYEWVSVGNGANIEALTFSGTFDGQYHCIYNLTSSEGTTSVNPDTNKYRSGLFGTLYNATVCNLGIENANISMPESDSSLNGKGILADSIYGSTIQNCWTSGSIVGNSGYDKYIGGLVGFVYNGTCNISGCYSSASIEGNCANADYFDSLGGIVGMVNNGSVTINDCWFDGNITVNSGQAAVGGIVGYADGTTTVQNCLVATTDIGVDSDGNTCWIGYIIGNANPQNCYWPIGNYAACISNAELAGSSVSDFKDSSVLQGLQSNAETNVSWVEGIEHPTFSYDTQNIAANYDAINEALISVPDDLSLYTEESVYNLETLINGIDWNLSALHQETVDTMAKAIADAIASLEYKAADYSAVDAAIEKANTLNKDEYENFSSVEAAVNAVVRDKNITEQAEVNAMAQAIEDAISALKYKAADYSAVDAAIEKVKALNKDEYENFSSVEAAVNAVVWDKNITEQAEVDAMAQAIEDAIDGLEEKQTDVPTKPTVPNDSNDSNQTNGATSPKTDDNQTDNTTSPKTGDNSNIALWIAVMLSAGAVLTGTAIYSRKRKYNR